MKKLLIAVGLGLMAGSVYAASIGCMTFDDTGCTIAGQVQNSNGVGLPTFTLATMNANSPTVAGQLIYVSNATRSKICVSSGTTAGAYILATSTGVFVAGSLEHCL